MPATWKPNAKNSATNSPSAEPPPHARGTRWHAAACLALLLAPAAALADPAPPKRIVFLPGTKSHGPGHHEYARGLRLLQRALERSALAERLECEIHYQGGPQDERALDHADGLVFFSDGSDRRLEAHPLVRPERLAKLDELARRGVGMVALH